MIKGWKMNGGYLPAIPFIFIDLWAAIDQVQKHVSPDDSCGLLGLLQLQVGTHLPAGERKMPSTK